eukprot:1156014-Pelagomonas_calceolata.AAC.17
MWVQGLGTMSTAADLTCSKSIRVTWALPRRLAGASLLKSRQSPPQVCQCSQWNVARRPELQLAPSSAVGWITHWADAQGGVQVSKLASFS